MPAPRRSSPSWRILGLIALLTISLAAGWAPTAAAQTPADRFEDDDDSIHEGAIDAIAAIGLTSGCNPPANDRYCPERHLSRAEMATMLTRVGELPPVSTARFVDTLSSVHRADIESLAAAGITNGCNPPSNDRFCPNRDLTRGQMAAFLVRTLGLEGGGAPFDDTVGSMFGAEISILAAEGITKGCNPPDNNLFCPDRAVTRAEMATFLARALDLTVVDNPGNDTPGTSLPPGDPPPANPPPPGGDNPDAEYPGQPRPGTVLWGAAVGQNTDPTERHEEPTGETLSVRRTFFQWEHRAGYMIWVASDDLANGRLPWVSIKPPAAGWEGLASGSYDDEID
ncbi:MAG TPA: S-layer homology domain-containing protein, partial [Acidimicrobiia bacterium]|nr:S-layer homology domain-containing protein [Acidimicrobiia bacterium]